MASSSHFSDRDRIELSRLERLVEAIAEVRLLVVGDVVLDEYLWGDVFRISPEAPVPVVHVGRESVVLGGAGNVVRNIVALGGGCEFCSVVGEDEDGERVRELLEAHGVDTGGVVSVSGRQTTRKTRVVAGAQQVVRVDRETPEPIAAAVAQELAGPVEVAAARVGGAILEDYGKGLLAADFARKLMSLLSEVPVSVDPKRELSPFRGAALLKPNLREAELLTGIRVRGREDLEQVAKRLREEGGFDALAITRGGEGMTVFDGDAPGVDIPTVARSVFDVQGAGDTTIAALALARCAGASLREAAIIANTAAGIVVEKMGTATASPEELCQRLPSALAAAGERT